MLEPCLLTRAGSKYYWKATPRKGDGYDPLLPLAGGFN